MKRGSESVVVGNIIVVVAIGTDPVSIVSVVGIAGPQPTIARATGHKKNKLFALKFNYITLLCIRQEGICSKAYEIEKKFVNIFGKFSILYII